MHMLSTTQMLAYISDCLTAVDSQSAKQVKDDFQFILTTCTVQSVCIFCFVSCKTSQNVNILQLLT